LKGLALGTVLDVIDAGLCIVRTEQLVSVWGEEERGERVESELY